MILYAFRCLVGADLPLNEGCLAPLTIVIPDGSFLSPPRGSAVVAGNTEVSQAVCNALLGALGACAAAQGTMNNFLFGNERYQYYETICGGAGAGPGFDGASAVHTHMTNTRITDPEILELRYPVRLDRFAIRRGSGGRGATQGRRDHPVDHRAGGDDGDDRRIPPDNRPVRPCRGGDGSTGVQHVQRADGTSQALAGVDQVALEAGDCLTIQTPGGGGFGLSADG
ncbi:hydantoinase B/oxoprolinase family protein [Sphingomonas sp. I4]